MRLLPLLVLLGLSLLSPAFGAGETPDAPAVETPVTKPRVRQQPVETGPRCYDVLVVIDTYRPDGTSHWDPWSGTRRNPDPVIIEKTTGSRVKCGDSFACYMRLTASGTLSFLIEDDDPDASDYIGAGQCTAGKSCRVGSADLTFTRC